MLVQYYYRDSPLITIFQTWRNVIIQTLPHHREWDHVKYKYNVCIYQLLSLRASLVGDSSFLCRNNGAPKRHPHQLKKIQCRLNFLQNTRYCTVKACLYRCKTQNQPSQPTKYTLFDYLMNTYADSADMLTFLIKQGRLTCFAFFIF